MGDQRKACPRRGVAGAVGDRRGLRRPACPEGQKSAGTSGPPPATAAPNEVRANREMRAVARMTVAPSAARRMVG
jgi:hypothetical protein